MISLPAAPGPGITASGGSRGGYRPQTKWLANARARKTLPESRPLASLPIRGAEIADHQTSMTVANDMNPNRHAPIKKTRA